MKFKSDKLGLIASTVCLVHCLLMPLVVPLLSFTFLEGMETHFLVIMILIAFYSAISGLQAHKKLLPFLLLVASGTLAAFVGTNESMHVWAHPLIAIGLLLGHTSNIWFHKQCREQHCCLRDN